MIAAAVVIGVLTVLRAYAAFNVPLTADEAYYWTWSLHPAFGYTDHPPMVAWLIALGGMFGHSAGFVRLPFVLCEAIAALAAGRAAMLVAGNVRAGVLTALLVRAHPADEARARRSTARRRLHGGVGGSRCGRRPRWTGGRTPRHVLGLGLALAAAILSRTFGWALVAGILAWSLEPVRRRRVWPNLTLAAAIVVVAYVPFVVWNAAARLGKLRVHLSHAPALRSRVTSPISRRCASSSTPRCWERSRGSSRCAASRA